MKTSIVFSILLVSVLLTTAVGCSDPPTIGVLVHEGPVALENRLCFAAVTSDDEVLWLSLDGASAPGPRLDAPRALAYSTAARALLVTTATDLVTVPIGEPAQRSRRQLAGAAIAWPLTDGMLIADELGRWTHERTPGETASRNLPLPVSMWEKDGELAWLGSGHPRISGPVLVQTDSTAPLANPRAAPAGPFQADARAAPHPHGGLAVAWIAEPSLVVSWPSGEMELPVEGERVAAVLWLTGITYAIAVEGPDRLLTIDLDTRDFMEVEGVRGPLAGPMTCPVTFPLP